MDYTVRGTLDRAYLLYESRRHGAHILFRTVIFISVIFSVFFNINLITSQVPTQIYMVDAFTKYAASALAATSVVRSMFGGCLPIAGLSMYSTLGYGWVRPALITKLYDANSSAGLSY